MFRPRIIYVSAFINLIIIDSIDKSQFTDHVPGLH